MLKRILLGVLALLVVVVIVVAGLAWYLHRRALPEVSGTVTVSGPHGTIEILRDKWGTPHIFAGSLEDAAFAEGWVVAQDRLFNLELLRRVTQGRLAEMVGPAVVETDKLMRTLDLHGQGKRMLERASPTVHTMSNAFAAGVNAYVAKLDGRLPIEFTLLRIGFAPLKPDDLAGIVPLMAFSLMDTWGFEPLYEKLTRKLGPERMARLFPDARGGPVGAYPPSGARAALSPSIIEAGIASAQTLGLLTEPGASNNWVVGPKKSASGQAILCNDPHLGLALPTTWYTVHVVTPEEDVAGVIIPGAPVIVIGHNRDIAWGLTNLMLDEGDFFIEKLNPEHPNQVMYRGKWVEMTQREEVIQVKGAEPVKLTVRNTPHGPLVNELLKGQTQALSLRWVVDAATDANDLDAFLGLNRARNWNEFRTALRGMGSVAQNFAYADRQGNIGVQGAGRIPVRQGVTTGMAYRVGWDGSEEWNGFVPFDRMPSTYNPPQGWIATANTSPFARPTPYYITATFEPRDRWLRITEVLQSKDKLSPADMAALQFDHTWVGARDLAVKLREAYAGHPPTDPTEAAALKLFDGWAGQMEVDSPAAAVFAEFYPNLFLEIYGDELGPDLEKEVQARGNMPWTLTRQVMEGDTVWLDRVDTHQKGSWPDVIRPAFSKAVARLKTQLGGEPASWTWGRLHTFEAVHPLGRVKWFAPYFNRGPYPVPGAGMTPAKMQYPWDAQGARKVNSGASMRQITDFADLNSATMVLPGGQSGIPASAHYADDLQLWLTGKNHPLPMDRKAIEQVLEAKQTLQPAGVQAATGATKQ